VPLVVNGWTLLYHPVFGQRYAELRNEARRLKRELPPDAFAAHPLVKLVAAVRRLLVEIVPADPNAPEFWLRGELARFRRARGHGLPPRYRLFWVFSQSTRVVIYLYLNDQATLRKEGSRSDPYEVFKGLVARGQIGADFDTNLAAWRRVHPE
jgi:toxin YhaV